MSEQKIKIHQVTIYDDGTKLEINFWGLSSKNISIKEKEQILNRLLLRKFAPDITEVATILKNIFRDVEEKILEIYIYKEEEFMRGACYFQNKLKVYSYHKSPTENNPIDIEIEYQQKKGVNLSTKGILNDEKELLQCQNIFSREMDYIKKLTSTSPHILSEKEKTICKFYQLFYQENPDFSKREDRIKAQSMLAFLKEFNITLYALEGPDLSDFYSFNLRKKHKMVTSIELTSDLNRLASLGKITKEASEIKLAPWVEKTIELVGQEIRKSMQTKENPTDWLKEVVKINHIKKYCLYSNSTSKDIATYGKSDEDTVIKALGLVKRINKKVDKANF
ncbi:MAG: hypothetical protein MR598_04540 [Erysipelotrichaceae bacterium]|nr:hypothetical protein [Erysipelotrichaceae bacterium]